MKSPYPSDSSSPTGRPAGSEAANAGSYAPSVPMSVYRELAAELQATKAMVDSLSSQNHYLAQQNHILKQEIHRAVQVTLNLGQFAGVPQTAGFEPEAIYPERSGQPGRSVPSEERFSTAASPPASPPNTKRSPQPPQPATDPHPSQPAVRPLAMMSKLFTEQSAPDRRLSSEPQGPKDMSSLWLIISITIIVLTAFGAGFLIMRPLLSDR